MEAAPQLHNYIIFYVPKHFAAPIGVGQNLEPGITAPQNSRFKTTTPRFMYRSTTTVQRRTRSQQTVVTARRVDSPAHELLNDHHTLATSAPKQPPHEGPHVLHRASKNATSHSERQEEPIQFWLTRHRNQKGRSHIIFHQNTSGSPVSRRADTSKAVGNRD